jgi:hypothetical protein
MNRWPHKDKPYSEKTRCPPSKTEQDWRNLPQRLRNRGDWLLARKRIIDAELMYDAATEIELLRVNLK